MFEVLKLNNISCSINNILEGYKLTDESANPDAIILRSFSMHEYETGDRLLAVARAGAGVNNIPLTKMMEKGVVVFNTPGANANAVKELVLCGMLLSCRDILGGIAWVNSLPADENVPKTTEKGKANFGGTEIIGKTLGVIGAGAIGVLVANMGITLGMKVLAHDPFLTEENRARLSSKVEIACLEKIYSECDFISLHAPLCPATRGMIDATAIGKMKNCVVILNFSRGELVNVPDIKAAIEEGKIRKYVVDFPSADVLNEKGIIVIPHLGASTEEAEENCAEMAACQLKDYLENGNIVNSVNYPCLSKIHTMPHRTTVLYKAGMNVAEKVARLFKNEKLDIANAEGCQSGYLIIDSEEKLDACLIQTIEGVYRVICR